MRAVFTLDLPVQVQETKKYPEDEEIVKLVASFGWGLVENEAASSAESNPSGDLKPAATKNKYQHLGRGLLAQMPEATAADEQNAVIFFGYLEDDKTSFIITRRVTGQITFRLLHQELPRLQLSTVKVVRRLLGSNAFNNPLHISNDQVVVYERGQEHIIIRGRVIPKPWKETIRTNKKDFLLSAVPAFLFIHVTAALGFLDGNKQPLLHGTMERLSTALLTTVIVSILGLVQTYWDIRRNRLIAWTVDTRSD